MLSVSTMTDWVLAFCVFELLSCNDAHECRSTRDKTATDMIPRAGPLALRSNEIVVEIGNEPRHSCEAVRQTCLVVFSTIVDCARAGSVFVLIGISRLFLSSK